MSLTGDLNDLQSQYDSARSQGYKTTTIRTAELGMLLEHRAALLEACRAALVECQNELARGMLLQFDEHGPHYKIWSDLTVILKAALATAEGR